MDTEKNQEQKAPAKVEKSKPRTVTASRTVDFPSLGWGINAGETRELPVDEQAQRTILSNQYISIKE